MKRVTQFIKIYWFEICILIIVVIAAFLRFYNFENRWGLAYDQARDNLIAREALRLYEFPLIGPFSSAGAFVYGPQWYLILMTTISVYSSSIITPWIIQGILYVLAVVLMIFIGKEIKDKFLGVLLGLMMSISPAQISHSTNLTSPSMVSIFSIFSFYFFIKFIKSSKLRYSFLLSLNIATAINIHFQAIGLLMFLPVAFIFIKNKLKNIPIIIIGLVIPFIPLIIFDLKTNFYESKNLLDYYLYGQYKIYVPNRWLTYLAVYWPKSWARIIGGESILGYIITGMLPLIFLYTIFKKKLSNLILGVILSFLGMVLWLRYYRGERYDGYIVFLHPLVLFFSAWIIYTIIKFNRFMGAMLFLLILFGSLNVIFPEIKNSTNYTAFRSEQWKNLLTKKYPGKKFALYDYSLRSSTFSFPLVLYLDEANMISDKGYKIGFGSKPKVLVQAHPEIKENKYGFTLRDLNSSSSAELSKDGWAFINPSQIYNGSQNWYKK